MVFSIFSDTLYGQNRLGISLSNYLGQKAPLRLHLTKENFLKLKVIQKLPGDKNYVKNSLK